MNPKLITAGVLASLFCAGVFAQAPQSNGTVINSPSSPAPAVAPAYSGAGGQVVYVPQLPSAQELTNAASAQGRTIERIEQSGSEMTVIYQGNGRSDTVSYRLLPAAGGMTATVNAPVASAAAPATVYYSQPAPVYYSDSYYAPGYYYPYGWYPPISVGFGFGYGHFGGYGYHGFGGFRGGFHGGFHR